MQRSSGKIDGTLTDLKAVTGTLNKQKDQISGIITNSNTVTRQLAEADLKKTITDVQSSMAGLKQTLQNADHALNGVTEVVSKINKGEGSLGKMMTDEQLYKDIKRLSTNADSLVNDMQQRPYRYIPLKSRRKVKKYDKLDAAAGGQ
jgi:phospholipid/cholesterol/gamma-HCH transport system substrate-binding protein